MVEHPHEPSSPATSSKLDVVTLKTVTSSSTTCTTGRIKLVSGVALCLLVLVSLLMVPIYNSRINLFSRTDEVVGQTFPRYPPVLVYRNATSHIVACIIPNACYTNRPWQRVLYVPSVYRSQEAILSHCRRFNNTEPRAKLQFYDQSKPPKKLWHFVDAIGVPFTTEWYSHFAHFSRELVESALVPMSLFLARSPPPKPFCHYSERDHTAARRCTTPELPSLEPRLVLSEKVMHPGTRWTFDILSMLLADRFQNGTYLAPSLRDDENNVACFRSMITSPLSFDAADKTHDVLFRKAGVVRDKPIPTQDNVEKAQVCAPRIVILTRRESSRIIPATVIQLFRDIIAQRLPTANIELVPQLGDLSTAEQVALMQRTDVLVSVHGAELSNALFLVLGVRIIEVFPFAYVGHFARYFTPMYRGVHARRTVIVSEPDSSGFSRCMGRTFTQDSLGRAGLTLYSQHAKLFHNASSEQERYDAADFWMPRFGARQCLRRQSIVISAQKLADITTRETLDACRFRLDTP